MDACPGRLNKVLFHIDFESFNSPDHYFDEYFTSLSAPMFSSGIWGQCSEFCGIGHGFMPIVIHSVKLENLFLALNMFLFGGIDIYIANLLFQYTKFINSNADLSPVRSVNMARYINALYPSTTDYSAELFGDYSSEFLK